MLMKINDEDALRLYQQGCGDRDMADYFGCTVQSIYYWRLKRKLKPNDVPRRKQKPSKRRDATLTPSEEKRARFFLRSLMWADRQAKERGKKVDIDSFMGYWRERDGDLYMMRKVNGL